MKRPIDFSSLGPDPLAAHLPTLDDIVGMIDDRLTKVATPFKRGHTPEKFNEAVLQAVKRAIATHKAHAARYGLKMPTRAFDYSGMEDADRAGLSVAATASLLQAVEQNSLNDIIGAAFVLGQLFEHDTARRDAEAET